MGFVRSTITRTGKENSEQTIASEIAGSSVNFLKHTRKTYNTEQSALEEQPRRQLQICSAARLPSTRRKRNLPASPLSDVHDPRRAPIKKQEEATTLQIYMATELKPEAPYYLWGSDTGVNFSQKDHPPV